MEKFVLTEDLIVGISEIDDQHRELIDRINSFIESLYTSDVKVLSEDIEKVFDFMFEYAKLHFSKEEEIMEKNSCPILNLQKVQHQFFLMEANKLKFELKSRGINSEIIEKTRKLLIEWFKSHISKMDKKIRECLDRQP
ncbi:MAG: hemerythrin family protein [Brevinematia bacterium]